jgi:ubiquinone/menaquinone biosynthesis C-methylase UbiE
MGIGDYLLYRVAKAWPSPMARYVKKFKAEPGTEAYSMAYAQNQFDLKVADGLMRSVTGLDVLEIGAGHGGISTYMAAVGARSVVGIDLNEVDLQFARRFVREVSARYAPDCRLPVEFLEMSADKMAFRDGQFDLVLADNVFEHFTQPQAVMREAYRVVKPGGGLLVPVFSSIWSKYALHLKHGLKVPWANLFFSERTIIRALARLAEDDPQLHEFYPGLKANPQRVRDVRRHGDLNDITYREFRKIAARIGFRVEWFTPIGMYVSKIIGRTPVLRHTLVADVFSTGATAYLRKPKLDGKERASR